MEPNERNDRTHAEPMNGVGDMGDLDPAWLDMVVAMDESIAQGAAPQVEATDRGVETVKLLQLLEEVWPRHGMEADKMPASIGRFVIRQVLGRGGFSTVYLAFDPLRRSEVALKVPYMNVRGSSELCRRFLREAQAAAALEHPNIQAIFEVGEAPPVWYLSSAYCRGPTLAQWNAHRPGEIPPPSDSARFVRVLSNAVQHMHSRGVFHRDLKPSNILLEGPPPAEARPGLPRYVPKIADFGLAKMLDTYDGETLSRTILGTPEYMAPEQAEGLRMVGPGVDVYSLGAIFYELLTGEVPVAGATNLETLRKLSTHEISSPRKLRPEIPRDLEAICLKCLEKRPEHRYLSAADLAADLTRFLQGESTVARPLSSARRLGRWIARHRVFASLIGLLALIPCLVVAGLILHERQLRSVNQDLADTATRERKFAREALEAQRLADERRKNAEVQAYAAELKLAADYFKESRLGLMGEVLTKHREPGERDLREFIGRYLWRQGERLRWIRVGANRDINDLAFHPKIKRWMAACGDGRIVTLDPVALKVANAWNPGIDEPTYAGLSSQGDRAFVASWKSQQTLAIGTWDANKSAFTFRHRQGTSSEPCSFQLSADGRFWMESDETLAKSVTIRETETAREIVTWSNPNYFATAFAVNADQTAWAVAYRKKDQDQPGPLVELRLYGPDRTKFRTLEEPSHIVHNLAFLPNGQQLLVVPFNGKTTLHDVASGKILHEFDCTAGQTKVITISPDGKLLAGHLEDRVLLFDLETGSPMPIHHTLEANVSSLASGPDQTVAIGGSDGIVRFWKPFLDLAPRVLPAHSPKECWSVVFDPQGRWLATAGDDHCVKIWRPDGTLIASKVEHDSLVSCVAVSKDGAWLASGSYDDRVIVWKADGLIPAKSLAGHQHDVRCLAFSDDGATLASAGRDLDIHLWDVASGELRHKLPLHTRQVRALVYPQQKDLLVSCCDDGKIGFWHAKTGALLHSEQLASPTWCLGVTPDGATAVVGAKDGELAFFDLAKLKAEPIRRNALSGIQHLAISPDGKTLATACKDQTIRLWHLPTHQEIVTLAKLEHQTNGLAFSADNRTLAAALHDGTIVQWSVP